MNAGVQQTSTRAFGIMRDIMHMEGWESVIIQPPSREMTSRLIDSLDEPGDGEIVGDAVYLTGVLGVGVFSGVAL